MISPTLTSNLSNFSKKWAANRLAVDVATRAGSSPVPSPDDISLDGDESLLVMSSYL